MTYGERLKIYWNSTLAWGVDYGEAGSSMALSEDSSFLIAGSFFSMKSYLGKLNSSDGSAIVSYYYNAIYNYILNKSKHPPLISLTSFSSFSFKFV